MLILRKKLYAFFLLCFISSLSQSVIAEDCLEYLSNSKSLIKEQINKKGYHFISGCRNLNPHVYIAIVNLDSDMFEINLTLSSETASTLFGPTGNLLEPISKHAQREKAFLAINGFTWEGIRPISEIDNGHQFKDRQFGYPLVTVHMKGKSINSVDSGEVSIAFSDRTSNGTKAKAFDRKNSGTSIPINLQHTIESSTTSIMVNKENRNQGGTTSEDRWSGIGIGEYSGNKSLFMISSSGNETTNSNELFEIFQALGTTDAIRLDGSGSASIYHYQHINKLTGNSKVIYGEARKILYALTVTKKPPLSKPQFENVSITSEVTFNETVNLTGVISSSNNISEISISTTKPDGQVLVTLIEPDDGSVDLSELEFDLEGETEQVGTYSITIIAKDSVEAESSKHLSIEVLPKIISMTPDPSEVEVGSPFVISVSGQKMPSTMVMMLGTDDLVCAENYINANDAKFTCDTYNAGNFRYRLYHRENGSLLKTQFINITEPPVQTECTPNEAQTRSCSITNGEGEQFRSCNSSGSAWGNYGTCEVTGCLDGYEQSGNTCVAEDSPEPEIGIPDDVQVGVSDVVPSIGVAWTSVSNADSYEIQLVDEGGGDDRTESTSGTSLILNDLSENHDYKLRVRVIINGQRGRYTNYVSFSIGEYGNNESCALDNFTNNTLSENLSEGDHDGVGGVSQVAELQNFLNELGHSAGTADGIFGGNTKSAVISYQQANGLDDDGIVGSNTRASINAHCD